MRWPQLGPRLQELQEQLNCYLHGEEKCNQGCLHARMLVVRQQDSEKVTSPPSELAVAPAWAPAVLCFSSLATFPLIKKAATTARSRVRAKRAMGAVVLDHERRCVGITR